MTNTKTNSATAIKWTKCPAGIYRTEGYEVDITKAGKDWLVTWGDGTMEHKTFKLAKAYAENDIIVRVEYIEAMDQDMNFSMVNWLKELATRADIAAAQAERIAALEDGGDDEQEAEYSSKMAKALAKARGHYTGSKASSGKKSLHNGDQLATLLAGCEPEEVCQLADLVCGEDAGFHADKYGHLNQGQQRMNAGNKIRGKIKREEILVTAVIDLANANLATLKT